MRLLPLFLLVGCSVFGGDGDGTVVAGAGGAAAGGGNGNGDGNNNDPGGDTSDTGILACPLPDDPIRTTLTGFTTDPDFDIHISLGHVTTNPPDVVARGTDGTATVVATNVSNKGAIAFRVLPDGAYLILEADGRVARISATGSQRTSVTTMQGGIALEVDSDGRAYVLLDNGAVRDLNVQSGDSEPAFSGIDEPTHMVLSNDGDTMYVSTDEARIYASTRLKKKGWTTPRVVWRGSGDGYVAVTVDACDALYFAQRGGDIFRMETQREDDATEIISTPAQTATGMRWGTGNDGWETTTLYVGERNTNVVYAIDVGVEGKPNVAADPDKSDK